MAAKSAPAEAAAAGEMSDMGEVALKRKKSNCGASLRKILFHLPKQDGRLGRAVPLFCLFRRCHVCFAAHVRRILPRYLREHSRRGTRILHFVGTMLFW